MAIVHSAAGFFVCLDTISHGSIESSQLGSNRTDDADYYHHMC